MQVAITGSPEVPPVAAFSAHKSGPSDLAFHGCDMPLEPSPDSLSGPPCCHLLRGLSAVHLPTIGQGLLHSRWYIGYSCCAVPLEVGTAANIQDKTTKSEHLCLCFCVHTIGHVPGWGRGEQRGNIFKVNQTRTLYGTLCCHKSVRLPCKNVVCPLQALLTLHLSRGSVTPESKLSVAMFQGRLQQRSPLPLSLSEGFCV